MEQIRFQFDYVFFMDSSNWLKSNENKFNTIYRHATSRPGVRVSRHDPDPKLLTGFFVAAETPRRATVIPAPCRHSRESLPSTPIGGRNPGGVRRGNGDLGPPTSHSRGSLPSTPIGGGNPGVERGSGIP